MSTQQPLTTYDLFWDAHQGNNNGEAVRTTEYDSKGNPTSHYRWLNATNPAKHHGPNQWHAGHAPADESRDWLFTLNQQPIVARQYKAWQSLHEKQHNETFRPLDQNHLENNTQDRDRYWVNHAFAPLDRSRELIFWAVNWKGYEDAEIAPGSQEDVSVNGYYWQDSDSTVRMAGMHPLRGHPERSLLWTDTKRKTRLMDVLSNGTLNGGEEYFPSISHSRIWPSSTANKGQRITDVWQGRWGADRNADNSLTQGTINKSTRLQANVVARFNFYDPILRLHVDN